MKWGDIQDGVLHVIQQKTRKELFIPVHSELAKELSRHDRRLGPILGRLPTKHHVEQIRQAVKALAKAHGFDGVPHGLRKNAVNALLEAGCTTAETAAISGQSLQLVEYYAKRRDQKKLGRKAMEKWEGNEK